ncbi:MAG: hypothetical protein ONB46_25920 [candidate division KSB1 bacterium]|nr:hypothetical protein [candidate division KSB1 bacterium]MDZ7369386.1 hypothetical protein [candidate division KSB1 bacterium]MDZ7407476.1 hypothetical protein [candidate division KSB1 bacterium]
MQFGGQSEVGKIKRLLLKSPQQAFVSEKNIDAQWRELNYTSAPDFAKAQREYESFVDLLEQHQAEIEFLPQNEATGLDSIYVHDPALITNRGVILCNMGKAQRRGDG